MWLGPKTRRFYTPIQKMGAKKIIGQWRTSPNFAIFWKTDHVLWLLLFRFGKNRQNWSRLTGLFCNLLSECSLQVSDVKSSRAYPNTQDSSIFHRYYRILRRGQACEIRGLHHEIKHVELPKMHLLKFHQLRPLMYDRPNFHMGCRQCMFCTQCALMATRGVWNCTIDAASEI
jgi:hypothetical protein